MQTVVFEIGEQRFGLQASVVERITPMVAVEPVPGAPDVVDGVIDVQGRLATVYSLRRRLGLADRAPDLWEHLIVLWAGPRFVAVRADRVLAVTELPTDAVAPLRDLTIAAPGIDGVARTADGVLLIHDPVTFLVPAEAEALDRAIAGRVQRLTEECD